MTVSRLLKSCATPPVSWPIASIFCAWRSASSVLPLVGAVHHDAGHADGLPVAAYSTWPLRRDPAHRAVGAPDPAFEVERRRSRIAAAKAASTADRSSCDDMGEEVGPAPGSASGSS